jgi:hypothetical protein
MDRDDVTVRLDSEQAARTIQVDDGKGRFVDIFILIVAINREFIVDIAPEGSFKGLV